MSTTTPVIEQEQAAPVASTVEQAAIEFRHVSISFEDKQVLHDVSFTLRRGETIIITGASESGKSVLLHLAIGLLRPDSGQIFVGRREIENLEENELLAIRGGEMGLVFQDETLFTGLSVYDNAAYRLADHGWSEEDTERAVEDGKGGVMICEADEQEQKRTQVMLLDGGRIAFLGNYADFVASALPAISHLLHPEPSGRAPVSYSPDPWNKRRKPRELF